MGVTIWDLLSEEGRQEGIAKAAVEALECFGDFWSDALEIYPFVLQGFGEGCVG